MRIDPEDRIIGYPALVVRDLMRRKVFDANSVIAVLKIDAAEAGRVIEALAAENYICPSTRFKSPNGAVWQTTPKGTQLANAGTLPSVSRAEADAIMAEFMARVKAVAESDDFFAEVAEVVLFGSYLTEAPTVNDVDLIVRLRLKGRFKARSYDDALRAKLESLAAKKQRLATGRDWLVYLQSEALGFLQAASPYVSLHRGDALQLIEMADRKRGLSEVGTPSKVVYSAAPRTRRAQPRG